MECGWRSLSVAIFLFCISQTSSQQRVAPGVPPQHYQGGQPQMHQVPVQHAQQPPPVQHHQVPVQVQHQQQQFAQQPPPVQQQQQQQHHQQGGHQMHHGHHGGPPQVLNVANIAQEKEHIAEHLSVPIDTSKMSEQELQFHYFKMHDSDNNNKLDGCELIKSLIHWHGESEGEVRVHKEEDLEIMVNTVLQGADMDNDGYITYAEFRSLNA